MKYLTKSEKQTFNLGKKLAKQLRGGEILALTGELGAGKTVLVKGIAQGLGIKKIITSPTFVLMKVYKTRIKNPAKRADRQESRLRQGSGGQARIKNLIHIDCYRIKNPQEIIDIGATEYFGQKGIVVVIEWADKIKKILPKQVIKINIEVKGEGNRLVSQDKPR